MVWALADPALNAYVGSAGAVGQPWPHLQQVLRVERQREVLHQGRVAKVEREVTYAISSLPPTRAPAGRLARALRSQWGIENRAHYVRDVVFDEDRSQVRSARAQSGHRSAAAGGLPVHRRGGADARRAPRLRRAARLIPGTHLMKWPCR
jgi:hypothetical protein